LQAAGFVLIVPAVANDCELGFVFMAIIWSVAFFEGEIDELSIFATLSFPLGGEGVVTPMWPKFVSSSIP